MLLFNKYGSLPHIWSDQEMKVVELSGDSVMLLHFCITLSKMFKGFDVIYTILRKHQT